MVGNYVMNKKYFFSILIGTVIGGIFTKKSLERTKKIYYKNDNIISEISSYIKGNLKEYHENDYIIICIGTNKISGDDLAPRIGTLLSNLNTFNVPIYGTLESPIHAKNIKNKIEEIKSKHPFSKIIAIDAGVGCSDSVGYISMKKGHIRPGNGNGDIKNSIPLLGDISIVGCVGLSCRYTNLNLVEQNINSNFVDEMTNGIYLGIVEAFR
jgi:putative sporulation protein YyaC